MSIEKLLVANRGEIACRILKTAARLNMQTVAVYSDADARALHRKLASQAVHIGASPAAHSYLNRDALLRAIRESGADAVHPGYGFLSEQADFAEQLQAEGITFVGPPPSAIEAMGDKITSKRIADEAGVSTIPGHLGVVGTADEAVEIARDLGYPVMLKASAGGGGKGMRVAEDDAAVREGFSAAQNEAQASFGDNRIFIEKFIVSPRHIEIQVLADQQGNIVHLGERECSIQRRNQKVIEEAPSPFLDAETRNAMGAEAIALARAVGYYSAGTVEFIVDQNRQFYFLEMNTRLQVEHPVTELITGLDLVELMLRIAQGEALPFDQEAVQFNGWAMESRVYAENPYSGFLPSTGRLTRYAPPPEGLDAAGATIRNDTGVSDGDEISRFYDPMIAKLCTHAQSRDTAIQAMVAALDRFELEGVQHNLPFLQALMAHPRFQKGALTTAFIDEEYPQGFQGHPLSAVQRQDWAAIAVLLEQRYAKALSASRGRPDMEAPLAVVLPDGATLTPQAEVLTQWQPGERLIEAAIETRRYCLQVARLTGGFWRLRGGGADWRVQVLREALLPLLVHLPKASDSDDAKALLSPMPGLLVSLDVSVGDQVVPGQALARLEAMKMENLLRATQAARVTQILVSPGDSLSLGDVIMEFEPLDEAES